MDGKSVLVAGGTIYFFVCYVMFISIYLLLLLFLILKGCYELYFYDLTTFQKIKTFTVADGLTKMLVANIIRIILFHKAKND